MRQNQECGTQRGIALLTVLLLLALLSAMAVGLMYMSGTETQINYNFRAEQTAYFAAKAGMEELRDRMISTNPNQIAGLLPTGPATTTSNILYLINDGGVAGSVQPWGTDPTKYPDTELCHDGYSGLGASVATDIPCPLGYGSGAIPPNLIVPGGSTLPFANTSAALPFKWARLTLKLDGSNQNYPVSGTTGVGSILPACWNAKNEVVSATTCADLKPTTNPVYLITALAVTKTGARKMVQGEVALTPSGPFLYGLFATGNGCGALDLSGVVSTDSYDSSKGTYLQTKSSTGGDVGSNGNVTANGNVSVGGSVASASFPASTGPCPGNGFTTIGKAEMVPNPNNVVQTIPVQNIPTPIIPATTGPNETNKSTFPPGNYGDIVIKNGTTTLSAGVYNVNSLTITANGQLAVTGPVVINVQGSGNSTPIDLEGQGISNPSGIASNVQINYAGGPTTCTAPPCGTVKIAGGSNAYFIIDAPVSTVTMVGNSDIYGAVVGYQINNSGTPSFHYDKNTKSPVPQSTYYSLISFRELFY